jgi:hypothetical protein
MGKFTKGVNGGFFGKTGSVVGSKWKGIHYMRGLPDPVKRKASPLQIIQQERFRFVSRFLQSIQPIIKTGFRNVEFKRSALNAALSDVMNNALDGEYPDFKIDYQDLSISRGALYAPNGCTAKMGEDKIDFSWNDDSAFKYVDEDDEVMLVALSDSHFPLYSVGEYLRPQASGSLSILNVPSGTVFHCYLAMASVQNKMVSNSNYLGEVTVS